MVYRGISWFILFGGVQCIVDHFRTNLHEVIRGKLFWLSVDCDCKWTPRPVCSPCMSFLQFPGRCFSSLGTLVMQSLPCRITLNQPLSPVHSHQQCFQFGIAHTDVMTKQRRCIGTFTTYGPWIGKQQDVAIEPHPDKNNRAVVKTIKCHYVPFTSSWPGFWFYIFLWLSMLLRDCPCFPWCSIVTTPTGNQTIVFGFVFLYYCSTMYMRCNWNSRL